MVVPPSVTVVVEQCLIQTAAVELVVEFVVDLAEMHYAAAAVKVPVGAGIANRTRVMSCHLA